MKRGYTRQTEFAPMVLMTQSSLSDVESKNKEFSAKQLMALCRVLKVSPGYIVEGGQESDMEEIELLRIFKQLPQAERSMLLKTATALLPNKANSLAA